MPANPKLWLRAKEIVGDALERPEHERSAFIATECGNDAALLSEVNAFLAAASDTAEFLKPLKSIEARLANFNDSASEQGGKLFGAYRLLNEIGRGGMSVVYLAARADGAYEQKVAVKLMLAATSPESVKRVGRERQALATLQHPNIARLIDGGVSTDNVPYLVMDYVDGERIDQWCERNQVDIRGRVALVASVCEAVQHAHQQLIVHRDIKPANILVNARGAPILLDFGVARLLETATPQMASDLTQEGALLFTPRYASPEQVRGLPATVATDVYGIGVLLFELLAGSSPFINISSQSATNTAAAMRAVLEDEFRPASKVAEQFAPKHSAQLRGELDLVLAKTCARDPAERYANVSQLAADLQCWLNDVPISVKPATALYRTQKFIRRHPVGVALGVFSFIAISAGVTGTFIQRQIAEARYAQALTLASKVTTKYYDAIESLPGATAVRKEMVADGLAFLDQLAEGAKDDPAIKVELAKGYQRLAEVMFNGRGMASIADKSGAEKSRDRADKLLEQALSQSPNNADALAASARVVADRAAVLGATGQTDLALGTFDRALDLFRSSLAQRDDDAVRFQYARNCIAAAQAALSGKQSGRRYLDQGRLEFDRWATTNPTDVSRIQVKALLLRTEYREAIRANDKKAALQFSDEEIAILEAELAAKPDNAVSWQHISIALLNSGLIQIDTNNASDGVARIRRAMEYTERIIAKDPVNYVVQGGLARMYMQLGRGLTKLDKSNEALETYRISVNRWETLAKRDLATYQVIQMGEAYFTLFSALQPSRKNEAKQAAQSLISHAQKHAAAFSKPPASDWVTAARNWVGQ
jgi:eukaryotic-like serine/threonine-protein kinase